MDVFNLEKRSQIMSRIRGKNTGIEKIIFQALREQKIKFIKHPKRIKGRPDLIDPDRKLAIFIDGDFWHGWQFPRWKGKLPKKYWSEKIESNRKRDKTISVALRKSGWKVLRIWEHQILRDANGSIQKVTSFLSKKNFRQS